MNNFLCTHPGDAESQCHKSNGPGGAATSSTCVLSRPSETYPGDAETREPASQIKQGQGVDGAVTSSTYELSRPREIHPAFASARGM